MKNKRFKKVLSVFLSILMLMSCWVWVAPTDAAAAGSYYVRVYLNIYDGANSDGYGKAYSVVDDINSEFYGKPNEYKWDYGSSWNAFDNSDGYDGEVNMAGFTLFYDNDKKYKAYDLSADLVAATTTLGNNWTSMDDLTLENFANCKNMIEKVYSFELDSMPSSLFWINDENNAVNGETSFGIHKITVAESSTSQEHILWTGLSGSESYYECYYGTITPTGLITPWDDCPGEDTKTFYKDYTTSAVGTWIDPFNAGDYNVYPVNNYLSGGVSATFTVGSNGAQTNIDYIELGNTNNYYINFTNHSTQTATITALNSSNLVNGYSNNLTIAPGETKSFTLKKASMSGDGNYYNFCFKYTLNNVFEKNGTTPVEFYQAAYIGTWNTSDDSSVIGPPTTSEANSGFTVYNGVDMDFMSQFMADTGIFETVSTTGNRTSDITFKYNYYLDNTDTKYTNWSQTGLRMYVKKWTYNVTIYFQPDTDDGGTMNLVGEIDNKDSASLSIADMVYSYSSASDSFKIPDSNNRPWARYNTPCIPQWSRASSMEWGTVTSNTTVAYFRFCGNLFKGSTTSSDPGIIRFTDMRWESTNNRAATFDGDINVYVFDKSQLRDCVRNLGGLGANWAPMRTRFNDAKWNAYESALQTAMQVLANHKTNQKAVTDAYNNLVSACEALKSTANLVNQVAEVTYTKRTADYNSAATDTTNKYLIMPIGTETAVPSYDAYKHTTSGTVVAKQSSNLKTNFTQYETGINPIDYRYWKIDFAGVDKAVEEATELLDTPLDAYSDKYYEEIFDARTAISYFDREADTWTPTYQSDVTDPLNELNALLAHNSAEAGAHTFIEDANGNYVIKFDETTHWYECEVCGYKYMHENHTTSATPDSNDENSHIVECTYVDNTSGNTCDFVMTESHTFTNPELARPTKNEDGTWTDGTYTYTCVCGATKSEPAERADYSELEEAIEALEGIKNDENLSDEAKTVIANTLTKADNLADNLVTAEQGQIDDLVKELQKVKADADEAIKNKELGVEKITEATSGVKVQFIDKSGLGTIESVQLGKDDGFKIRVANGNADSNITITNIQGDGISETADQTLESGKSADFDVTMPTTAGIHEYTITYTIDGLKNPDGTAVPATTKAYLYVKGAAYQPYHYVDEKCANGSAHPYWNFYLDSTYYGDFELVHATKAPYDAFGNENLVQDGASITDYVREQYDYENDSCYAGCTTDKWASGDAHAATYRYYIDTSLADTYEKAGLRARLVESTTSNYDNAPFIYVRLANNGKYLEAIPGSDKTFSTTLVPSATSNVPTKTWIATSNGDTTVSELRNSNEDEWIFGAHAKDSTSIATGIANFSGVIPQNSYETADKVGADDDTEAKLMFSWRMEFNKGTIIKQAEAVTMTTHLYITSYDKADLREAVEKAEQAGYNSAYFNAEKYEAYENALKTAKEVLGKAETNQAEIDAATDALENAIAALNSEGAEVKLVLTVTHSIHENADKNSEATSTLTDYYLVNGEITPALDEATTNLTTINKYDAPAKLNITADAEHTYNYWYIDYSGVQDAIAEAQNIIDNADKYDPDFVTAVTNAKNALEVIKNGESATTTPESQDDVDNAIKAVTNLTGHGCADEDKNHKCDICGATMGTHEDSATDSDHVCDYGCGVTLENCTDVDTDTDHNCDICGAENVTSHNYVNPVLTRPTKNEDGTWKKGYYTSTCNCGDTTTTEVERANYEAYDEAKSALESLLTDKTITDAAKAEIESVLNTNKIADNHIATEKEQAIVDAAANALNEALRELTDEEGKLEDGYKKPDYTKWEEAETAYDALDMTNVKSDIIAEAEGLKKQIADKQADYSLTQATATQTQIDEATARLNQIIAGINNGTMKNPDYSDAENAIQNAKNTADSENIPDNKELEIEAEIAELERQLEELKNTNPDSTDTEALAKIEEIKKAAEDIVETYKNCAKGNHTDAMGDDNHNCDTCGKADVTEHDYADATCTAPKTCNECGATDGEANGHDWGEGWKLTLAPTKDTEGTYTRVCTKGDATETKSVAREDYSAYDKAIKKAEELLKKDELTQAAKDLIEAAITEAKKLEQNLPEDVVENGETIIDNDSAEKIAEAAGKLNEVLNGIVDEEGNLKDEYKKPDTKAAEDAVGKAEALEVKIELPADVKTQIDNLRTELDDILDNISTDDNATEAKYKDDLKKVEDAANQILEKYAACEKDGHKFGAEVIATYPVYNEETKTWSQGTYTCTCEVCGYVKTIAYDRANYEVYDKALADLNALLASDNITEAAKTEIREVINKNTIRNDLMTPDQDKVTAAADALKAEVDKIKNDTKGAYEKVDYTNYNNAVGAYNALDGVMTDADKAAVETIKTEIAKIPADGSKKDYQAQVDKAAEDIAAINAKYGDCANGNHTWGEPILTKKPTATEQGEYTETCGICGTTQITKVDLADYSEFNTVVDQLEDLLDTENLTDEAKAAIEEALDMAEALDKNLPADATTVDGKLIKGGQKTINDLVEELKQVVADTNAAIGDGSAVYVDLDAYKAALEIYNTKTVSVAKDADKETAQEAIDSVAGITETSTKANGNQDKINAATATLEELNEKYKNCAAGNHTDADNDNNHNCDTCGKADVTEHDYADATCTAPKTCNECGATDGSANGHDWSAWTFEKATTPTKENVGTYTRTCSKGDATETKSVAREDYSDYDEAIEDANDLLDDENLTEAAKNEIRDAIEDAEKLDQNLPKDVVEDGETIIDNNSKETIKDATDALNEVLDKIKNDTTGVYEKPDYSEAEQAIDNADALDSITQEDEAILDGLKEDLQEIKDKKNPEANAKDDQDDVNAIRDAVNNIINKYAGCEEGKHKWGTPVLTTKPTETTKGVYIETCTVCGATQTTEVDLADYSEFNTVVKQLEDLAKTKNLTETAAKAIADALAKAEALDKNLPADATTVGGQFVEGGQDEIDALVEALKKVVADTNAAIIDGSALLPDYTAWETAEKAYDALDKKNVKDEIIAEAEALKTKIDNLQKDDALTQATATQKDIDDATKRLNEIIAGIENGTLLNPDAECKHNNCAVTVVAPTCHSLGYTLHVCKNCGYAYRTDEQPATDDHKWGRWFETESGSCLEYRMHERSCLNEGCYEKQIEIMRDANGDALYGKHYVVVIKGQAATCVAPGYTDYERCVVCGEITEAEVIPATGHIDNNKNGNCDVCNYVTNPSIGKCDCLCHNDSFFGKLLYNFVNFFWKLFKIQQGCQCGAQHW